MDFEQSQKRWVGMGHGHVGAGLGRMRKDCSEKCPKKNKQEPWRQLALCESEEALATVTCSSCTLRVRLDGPSSPDLQSGLPPDWCAVAWQPAGGAEPLAAGRIGRAPSPAGVLRAHSRSGLEAHPVLLKDINMHRDLQASEPPAGWPPDLARARYLRPSGLGSAWGQVSVRLRLH